MSEEVTKTIEKTEQAPVAPAGRDTSRKPMGQGGPRRGGSRFGRPEKPRDEFDQKVLEIRRVARVTGGGKRFSFRASVVVGNRKGKVGFGTAKGLDVTLSVEKAVRAAKKDILVIPIVKGTIPHEVTGKFKAGKILMKPSAEGRGIIAGGAMRLICDLAGLSSVTGKIVGKSTNKINIAKATLVALKKLKSNKK